MAKREQTDPVQIGQRKQKVAELRTALLAGQPVIVEDLISPIDVLLNKGFSGIHRLGEGGVRGENNHGSDCDDHDDSRRKSLPSGCICVHVRLSGLRCSLSSKFANVR